MGEAGAVRCRGMFGVVFGVVRSVVPATLVLATACVGAVVRNNPAPPTYSGVKARTLMGSVIKKRRKRMAKKKHRKLLRKTRHQRRNKK